MNTFMGDNFMLHNDAAEHLYHSHAANMPIVDFHCHLDPKQIAENKRFGNMTEIWLGGDHYKWRAMRANGVDESFITGDKPAFDKFCKWAETVPYTMRNPLYHWTHLELKRIFGIDRLLNPASAAEIYEAGNALLQTDAFSAQAIMQRMKVEVVCTTDDPADSLEYHQQIAAGSCITRVLPTWRPDKSILVENPTAYNTYIEQLEQASGRSIVTFADLLDALKQRHDFFASVGCRISDHSIDRFYGEPFTDAQLAAIFDNVRTGKTLMQEDVNTFKAGTLYHLAVMDAEKDWAQQFHIGATRNNNTKMFRKLGADTGFDAIGDKEQAAHFSRFFDRLTEADKLAKTVIYNLNPRDNELLITNAYSYNDGSVAGKMQFGSAWWFLDQKEGMRKQINDLSALGLLSRFVGMLTDSRSFLSYPRHEYFRRILCNLIGEDIEKGELPLSEISFIGQMVEDICYNNAKKYFNL